MDWANHARYQLYMCTIWKKMLMLLQHRFFFWISETQPRRVGEPLPGELRLREVLRARIIPSKTEAGKRNLHARPSRARGCRRKGKKNICECLIIWVSPSKLRSLLIFNPIGGATSGWAPRPAAQVGGGEADHVPDRGHPAPGHHGGGRETLHPHQDQQWHSDAR